MDADSEQIHAQVLEERSRHLRRLRDGCRVSFGGLEPLQGWVADEVRTLGGAVSEFEATESALVDQPAYRPTLEEDPDAVWTGTNVVGEFFGDQSSSLLLYAHADTDPAAVEHVRAGYGVEETDDRIIAPGIADDVSGLTAILSALEVVEASDAEPSHAVTVASILGKQCGVAGTHELVRRHEPTDGAVYVHPAESGTGLSEVKVGSNGVLEFEVTIRGVQPETSELHHTLFAEAGANPLSVAARLGGHLEAWVSTLDERYHHRAVEELAGRSAGVLLGGLDVDGTSVYRIPDACRLRGVVSFPPGASLEAIREAFEEAVTSFVVDDPNLSTDRVAVEWGDLVADAAETDLSAPVATRTAAVLESVTGRSPSWYYGHAASDIRYPMQYWGTEALGFGPRAGDMGEPTEWVDRSEYLETVTALARLLTTPLD
ncbi:M20 family metallopeptidase [Salinigranum sp. GCM10025319]|uniref:M20 family metallopeptidase n=1 Tax=Salinigranum sp. GCM10025319 TaxID=3252687 RepID=UPI00361EB25F